MSINYHPNYQKLSATGEPARGGCCRKDAGDEGLVGLTPEQRFAPEKTHLQPLPDTDFDTSYFNIRHVSRDSYIEVGGNRYSVPGMLRGYRRYGTRR